EEIHASNAGDGDVRRSSGSLQRAAGLGTGPLDSIGKINGLWKAPERNPDTRFGQDNVWDVLRECLERSDVRRRSDLLLLVRSETGLQVRVNGGSPSGRFRQAAPRQEMFGRAPEW